MNTIIYLALISFLLLWSTFVFYCAVMRLQQLRDAGRLNFKDHPFRWIMAYLFVLPIGLLLDSILNVVVFTVVGWERPYEWLTTARFQRWYNFGTPWQKAVATFFGDEFLNDIDPSGKHVF